jgi:hypothetical protein
MKKSRGGSNLADGDDAISEYTQLKPHPVMENYEYTMELILREPVLTIGFEQSGLPGESSAGHS